MRIWQAIMITSLILYGLTAPRNHLKYFIPLLLYDRYELHLHQEDTPDAST